ncbi:hypothetical protein BH24PSE2_BH24PSE2_21850 [soil metagenome]
MHQFVAKAGAVGLVVLMLVACGGGGGDDGGGGAPGPTPSPNPSPPAPGEAVVSGKVTYDRVPHNPITNGLDYASTFVAPVRGAVVEAVGSSGNTLATGETDAQGNYALTVPAETNLFIRVKAQALRAGVPSWDFAVVDNTNGDALYVLDGSSFDSATGASVRDLHADSGWSGASYTEPRSAAPFAILDTVYEAFMLVRGADPAARFPPLELNWSPDNRPVSPFDAEAGDIVTSSYRFSGGEREIFILGSADNDTDEYDQHVVAHEWAHYFENEFSRSDSIGGPHSVDDYLDPRVAFGEGFGNAFSGMALDEPIYRDSLGARQSMGFPVNVENNDLAEQHEGWYSEASVQAILYDIYDAANEELDAVTLGFGPIYDVLTNAQRNTPVLATIFTFIPPLKAARPEAADNIDQLVAAERIVSVGMDEFGTGETNNAGNAQDVLPVYMPIDIGGSEEICSLGDDPKQPPQSYGSINKLSNARFLKFDVDVSRSYVFTATGGAGTDPDMVLHQRGIIAVSDDPPPGPESFSRRLDPGTYVLEIYEFANITEDPRGRTCFTVSIT